MYWVSVPWTHLLWRTPVKESCHCVRVLKGLNRVKFLTCWTTKVWCLVISTRPWGYNFDSGFSPSECVVQTLPSRGVHLTSQEKRYFLTGGRGLVISLNLYGGSLWTVVFLPQTIERGKDGPEWDRWKSLKNSFPTIFFLGQSKTTK